MGAYNPASIPPSVVGNPMSLMQSQMDSPTQVPAPAIYKVTPSEYSKSGGIEISILGSNFSRDMEIYFGDVPTPSILQVPGAREVAIEFTSMSKTYSMAGWRIGFAAGNRELVGALTRVKSYLDYGAFTPVQAASAVA